MHQKSSTWWPQLVHRPRVQKINEWNVKNITANLLLAPEPQPKSATARPSSRRDRRWAAHTKHTHSGMCWTQKLDRLDSGIWTIWIWWDDPWKVLEFKFLLEVVDKGRIWRKWSTYQFKYQNPIEQKFVYHLVLQAVRFLLSVCTLFNTHNAGNLFTDVHRKNQVAFGASGSFCMEGEIAQSCCVPWDFLLEGIWTQQTNFGILWQAVLRCSYKRHP